MRHLLFTIAFLLPGATTAWAQEKAQPLNPVPKNDEMAREKRLDDILTAWGSRMTALDSFYTKCTRTDKEPLLKKETTFVGEAMFQRPNLAKIDLVNKANQGDFERIYFKGKHIFNYQPREKKVMVHEIPEMKPTDENMILAFLKGMKPEDARKRFKLTLLKESEFYAYVNIEPRTDADKQDFVTAELVLCIKNWNPKDKPNVEMMPARFRYREPNGKEVIYLFEEMTPNKKMDETVFAPTKPQGWVVQYANPNPVVVPKPKAPVPPKQ